MKICLLDMLPNYYAWTNTNRTRVTVAWHWLFMAQPEPFPETMISAVSAEWFLKTAGGNRKAPKIVLDEYIRCWTKKTITGACRDYRAFAGIDGVGWNAPDGGFFAVLDTPVIADDALLEVSARDYGVLWTPMSMFYAGTGGNRQIRLSASYLPPARIEEGVHRLARLITERR